MFGFSTDCKKDIKINIMLNALMEDNTDDLLILLKKNLLLFLLTFVKYEVANKVLY